jgi:hypothetical protein
MGSGQIHFQEETKVTETRVRLASRLTGWDIRIVSNESV